MRKLKAFKLIISISALMFVVKPFLGFGAINREFKQCVSHTILVKSFTKRKPESLEDADEKAEAIRTALTNPLLLLLPAISFLLNILFPSVPENITHLTGKFIRTARTAFTPVQPAYLLAGKLII